jgi:serine protease AprX
MIFFSNESQLFSDAGGTVNRHPFLRLTAFVLALAAIVALPGSAMADARLSSELVQQLAAALPLQQLQIVVTYKQSGPASTPQIQALQLLGITRGIRFRALPTVGAVATPRAIRQLSTGSDLM